jgi:hypothetical protein
VTRGFTIELPSFVPTNNISSVYQLRQLPHYSDTLHIDLVTSFLNVPMTERADEVAAQSIPASHSIKCTLVDKTSGKVMHVCQSEVTKLPTMQNPMLRRKSVFNLAKIPADRIPRKADLELRVEFTTGGSPVNREFIICVSMVPPYA